MKIKSVFNKRKFYGVVKAYILYLVFLAIGTALLIFVVQRLISPHNLYVRPIPLEKNLVNATLENDRVIQGIEHALQKRNISFTRVLASDSSYLVFLQNDEEILFSRAKPVEGQVSSLQIIMSRLTIEGKRIASLDFRYDKPVVVFK